MPTPFTMRENLIHHLSYRMIRNLIWMNGVSVDEKFVREFLVKLDTETIKHRPTVAWERRHLRDQALLGVCSLSLLSPFPYVLASPPLPPNHS